MHNIKALGNSRKLPLHDKLRSIHDQLESIIGGINMGNRDLEVITCIEKFVMRGKSGQSLQRLIGVILVACSGWSSDIIEVQNTTVKRIVGINGNSDKEEVASGVLEFFKDNTKSRKIIKRLIKDEEWDILDSLAIGIAGTEGKW